MQIDPEEGRITDPDRAREYLERYFQTSDITIYWGSTESFVKELHDHWVEPVNAQALEPATVAANPFVGPRAYGRHDRLYGRDRRDRRPARPPRRRAGRAAALALRSREDLAHPGPADASARGGRLSGAARSSAPATSAPSSDLPDGAPCAEPVRAEHAAVPRGGPVRRQLQRPVAELAGLTIAQYLAEAPRPEGAPANEVLIFDQFEEVLTASQVDVDAKAEFFTQLGAALRGPGALGAVRDPRGLPRRARPLRAASPDPFRQPLPARSARDGRGTPGHHALGPRRRAWRFTRTRPRKLVDDLRRVRVQHLGEVVEQLGPYVEPVQLQVVCRQIWDRLKPGARSIDPTDVEDVGDVNQALADVLRDEHRNDRGPRPALLSASCGTGSTAS